MAPSVFAYLRLDCHSHLLLFGRRLSLLTHPDKNPHEEAATARDLGCEGCKGGLIWAQAISLIPLGQYEVLQLIHFQTVCVRHTARGGKIGALISSSSSEAFRKLSDSMRQGVGQRVVKFCSARLVCSLHKKHNSIIFWIEKVVDDFLPVDDFKRSCLLVTFRKV